MLHVTHIVAVLAAAILAPTPWTSASPEPPDLAEALGEPRSEMALAIERYQADRGALLRKYPVDLAPRRRERMTRFFDEWLVAMQAVDFAKLSRDAQVDWILLRNELRRERRKIDIDAAAFAEASTLVPFMADVAALAESREAIPPPSAEQAADQLAAIATKASDAEKALRKSIDEANAEHPRPTAAVCRRAHLSLDEARRELRHWHGFRAGYDPTFSWWTDVPFGKADSALESLDRALKERGMGQTSDAPDVIVGSPIGLDALLAELEFEMIPYTPEELVAIGEREFAWCEEQLKKAANEMGHGDDWKAALEEVKCDHVEPGDQPALIRELALEAIEYLKKNELITVPALAEETWRMEMMSPARQKVTPFFTGGETISVAFPTADMAHDLKMMSLRGNNRHFARATVFHELIPGHGLQQYVESRWRPWRGPFGTAFWTEGWALYWEMLMWDRGFQTTPQDKIGALFWRAHRAARIVFSLKYQLGQMSAQECVDFLVDRVGHERANAEGEVRRSVSGDYGPLYQIAYMIGGLQLRALHHELVDAKKMTDRQFHDAVMHENNMPIEMVRAALRGDGLSADFKSSWRFDDEAKAVPRRE